MTGPGGGERTAGRSQAVTYGRGRRWGGKGDAECRDAGFQVGAMQSGTARQKPQRGAGRGGEGKADAELRASRMKGRFGSWRRLLQPEPQRGIQRQPCCWAAGLHLGPVYRLKSEPYRGFGRGLRDFMAGGRGSRTQMTVLVRRPAGTRVLGYSRRNEGRPILPRA
ncbi:hypothetical protein GCM10020369_43990 [Cryptosporangium minutisporangium]|uniref:Uncharacterized protein n=1 Tax=Cryptosporangium minutisporangium TaxID=113569 RepID=A0ABP6T0V3_9ACTN